MGWVEASFMVALYWAAAGPTSANTISIARPDMTTLFIAIPPRFNVVYTKDNLTDDEPLRERSPARHLRQKGERDSCPFLS